MPYNEHPCFSVGVVLQLISTLPNFKLKDLANQESFSMTQEYLSLLINFHIDFLSQRHTFTEAWLFCNLVCSVLREKKFYCDNNREIMKIFLKGELSTVIKKDAQLPIKNKIIDLIEAPILWLKYMDRNNNEIEFIERFYESLFIILYIAIEVKNNNKNSPQNRGSINENEFGLRRSAYKMWNTQLNRTSDAFKDYLNGNINDNVLWQKISLGTTMDINGNPRQHIDVQMLEINKVHARQIVFNLCENKPTLAGAASYFLGYAIKHHLLGGEDPARMNDFILPNDQVIALPYNELIACDGNLPDLTADRFNAEDSEETINIPEDFNLLHQNMNEYIILQKVLSLRNGYEPLSYRKVHIDTFETALINPGREEDIKYILKISSIDYFMHCIVRGYLKGDENYGGNSNTEEAIKLRQEYDDNIRFTVSGLIANNKAFYFMAGCGVWVVSSDGDLIISLRRKVAEKPGCIGYSAAGSCEYSKRLNPEGTLLIREANPFLTARRELFEECNLDISLNQLILVSFGIDYERYLQQFSFFHHSSLSTVKILDAARKSRSSNEQDVFALPFNYNTIVELVTNYKMEPGAIVSLRNIYAKYGKSY